MHRSNDSLSVSDYPNANSTWWKSLSSTDKFASRISAGKLNSPLASAKTANVENPELCAGGLTIPASFYMFLSLLES
jgi:hypothetical protein